MRILVDITKHDDGMVTAHHWLDTEQTQNLPKHHTRDGNYVDMDEFLVALNADPDKRESGGWHVVNQLPGEEKPLTRWQRLLAVTNHPDSPLAVRILDLRE